MSLNSLFRSFDLFHISFSALLFSSNFSFSKKFIFLGDFSSFYFSFFNMFFYFFFLSFIEIINFYWSLFINTCFVSNIFIYFGDFFQRFNFFLVSVSFKDSMKGTFKVETSPFSRTVNFKKDIRVKIFLCCYKLFLSPM